MDFLIDSAGKNVVRVDYDESRLVILTRQVERWPVIAQGSASARTTRSARAAVVEPDGKPIGDGTAGPWTRALAAALDDLDERRAGAGTGTIQP